MHSTVSHAQLYADYGLMLTIAQVVAVLGILAFGAVETYMAYRFFQFAHRTEFWSGHGMDPLRALSIVRPDHRHHPPTPERTMAIGEPPIRQRCIELSALRINIAIISFASDVPRSGLIDHDLHSLNQ